MKDKYWCSNLSCKSKDTCERFINNESPLDALKELNNGCNNYLFPFKSGVMKRPFSPDKRGRCNSYIMIDGENQRKNFLSGGIK